MAEGLPIFSMVDPSLDVSSAPAPQCEQALQQSSRTIGLSLGY